METTLLSGTSLANRLTDRIRIELMSAGVKPGLAVVLVGNNEASRLYVGRKQKKAQELGMHSVLCSFPDDIKEDDLLAEIETLSGRQDIHGILVQLPLPPQIDPYRVQERVPALKDVDGFNPYNQGALLLGRPQLVPCTPLGVLYLLVENGVQLKGRRAVVVGRSTIVGKPMALLLLQANATVSVCHSNTQELADYTRNADIVVVAVGKPKFILKEHVKQGAAVVDVGQHRLPTGVLCGDTDIPGLMGHVGYLTPVPGGVGPMTVAMLMWNTLLAFLLQKGPGKVHPPSLGAIHENLFGHLDTLFLDPSVRRER